MKNLVLGAFIVLSGFAFADSAEAQAACYTWSCDAVSKTCSFNASCSDGSPLNYQWDFGDGSTANSFNPSASHTYAPGTYAANVNLSVGYLFIGYYDITCNVKMDTLGPPQATYSGTCS